jgi:hypothetical protein
MRCAAIVQRSNSIPTGQWSEPMTSGMIQARRKAGRNLGEIKK